MSEIGNSPEVLRRAQSSRSRLCAEFPRRAARHHVRRDIAVVKGRRAAVKEGEDDQRDAEYSGEKSTHWLAMVITALVALAIIAAGIYFAGG